MLNDEAAIAALVHRPPCVVPGTLQYRPAWLSCQLSSAFLSAAPRRAGLPGDEEADSLHGLGGYHGSVHLTNPDGTAAIVYYAVGVFSEQLADGTVNGIPVFDPPWKNVVATFYHELNEARADADVEDAIDAGDDRAAERFLGWTARQGEECADFPVFEADPLTQVFQDVPLADGSGTVPVPFMYSNAVHGPEGPIDTPHPVAGTRDGNGEDRGDA